MHSMTGYGRGEAEGLGSHFQIDIKSVNHRYLDIGVHMPGQLAALENLIRRKLKDRLGRGKVDIYLSWKNEDNATGTLCYDEQLAGQYIKHLRSLADTYDLSNQVNAYQISRYPHVFSMEEEPVDAESYWPVVEEALNAALEAFLRARSEEGEYLRRDLKEKLQELTLHVDAVRERYPVVMQEYEQKLTDKLHTLIEDGKVDEGRIAAELILVSDKLCTDEEVVRLQSHIEQMDQTLDMDEQIGKKLDFLAQEMNRESNTILSKTNDAETADHAIALKTIIEKIREQIQNIE